MKYLVDVFGANKIVMGTDYPFDMGEDADNVESAVERVLDAGLRTGDIMSDGKKLVSTEEMGKAVVAEIDQIFASQ